MDTSSPVGTTGRYAIGVDRGGTNLRVGLVRNDGKVLNFLRRRRPFGGRMDLDHALSDLVTLIREVMDSREASGLTLDGIGIATDGHVDENGVIIGTCIPGDRPWTPVPLRAIVEQRLAIDIPVHVAVDSQGAAWGEYLYGAGRGTRHMVCVTIGTGIGGGLVLDGKLFRGACGSAGHVGFISVDMHGRRCPSGVMGCVEDYASGTAIGKAARGALEDGGQSTMLRLAGGNLEAVRSELVFEAARGGDVLAREIVEDAAYALGIAVASLLHVVNPDVVVIGGGVAEQGDMFLDPVRRTVAEYGMPNFAKAPIKQAELGDFAGVIGGAALCWP